MAKPSRCRLLLWEAAHLRSGSCEHRRKRHASIPRGRSDCGEVGAGAWAFILWVGLFAVNPLSNEPASVRDRQTLGRTPSWIGKPSTSVSRQMARRIFFSTQS